MGQVSIKMIDGGLQASDGMKVCVHSISSTSSLATDDIDSDASTTDYRSRPTQKVVNVAYPDPTLWLKTKETARLSQIKLKVQVRDIKNSWQSKSETQQPYHPTREPLPRQCGNNKVKAVETGRTLVNAQNGKHHQQSVVDIGRENHTDLYSLTDEEEQLHTLCLDKLPMSLHSPSRYLGNTLQEKVAQFFGTDFCYTTSTDYAANILAISAVLDENWLLVIDERSHDSMHAGAESSHVGQIIKFRHSDMVHLESILETERHKWTHALVAVEDLCSIEGTVTDLKELDRLKEQYYFNLLANEAQSFGLLGCTGRGSVEHWNDQHPDEQLPMDLFDIRTASFSRAFGAIGGVVCGNARFASCIRQRREELYTHGMERLCPTAMIQALHNLNQPTKLRRKLERLRRINLFMYQELTGRGMYVYEQGSTPGLSIHTARSTVAVKYAHVLRKHCVPANPVSAPLVPSWQSRCHIPISADKNDAGVDALLKALIDTAETCRIISKGKYSQLKFITEHGEVDVLETQEARNSLKSITHLIDRDAAALKEMPRPSDGVIRAGHAARHQHGVTQCGSASHPSHLDAERATCEFLGMSETVLYNDSYFGLMSTMAALCRLPVGYHKHHLFLPEECCQAVLDGLKIAPSKAATSLGYYKDIRTLVSKVRGVTDSKSYTTVYFESRTDKSKEDLLDFFATFARLKRGCNIRLLMNDLQLPGSDLQKAVVVAARECGVEVLLFGSLSETIHLPGAYLSGDSKLMGELRYKGHEFMSTASHLPFAAAMVAEGLSEMKQSSI